MTESNNALMLQEKGCDSRSRERKMGIVVCFWCLEQRGGKTAFAAAAHTAMRRERLDHRLLGESHSKQLLLSRLEDERRDQAHAHSSTCMCNERRQRQASESIDFPLSLSSGTTTAAAACMFVATAAAVCSGENRTGQTRVSLSSAPTGPPLIRQHRMHIVKVHIVHAVMNANMRLERLLVSHTRARTSPSASRESEREERSE